MRIITFSRNGSVEHGVRVGDHVRVHPTAAGAVDLAMNAADHPAGEEIALADAVVYSPGMASWRRSAKSVASAHSAPEASRSLAQRGRTLQKERLTM